MNRKQVAKILAIVGLIVIVANLALIAFGHITWRLFWVVVLFCAALAYFIIPKIRGKN